MSGLHRDSADLIYDPEQRNVLLGSFLEAVEAPPSIDCGVHRGDEMFAYALGACQNSWNDALVMYHAGGALGWRVVDQLLDCIEAPSRWLDFGCGYGRVLRFARASRPELDIVGCEIDERAARFVASRYGVRSLPSTRRPDDLELPRAVDLATAQSVFTHLPEPSFSAWLERLWAAVAAGGILAVSTNDSARMPMGVGGSDSDFVFERHSESALLGRDDYGTTWVSANWMRRLAEHVGGTDLASVQVVERGLWNAQDLWILRKRAASGHTLPALSLEPAPVGYIEGVELLGPCRVRIEGWCLTRAERPPRLVVEVIGEEGQLDHFELERFEHRADLRAEFGPEHRGGSWSVELNSHRPLRGLEILRVLVDDWPIHVSLLDAADRRVRSERRIHELEVGQRILKDELERKGGLPLRLARAVLRRLGSR